MGSRLHVLLHLSVYAKATKRRGRASPGLPRRLWQHP